MGRSSNGRFNLSASAAAEVIPATEEWHPSSITGFKHEKFSVALS